MQEDMKEKIREVISKEEYERFHADYVRMWNWLSQHPNADKLDYFAELGLVENIPIDYCYACEVARKVSDELRVCSGIAREYFWCYGARCYYCPFVGDVDRGICCVAYDKWRFSHSTFYAKQIGETSWWSYNQYLDSLVRVYEWIENVVQGAIE